MYPLFFFFTYVALGFIMFSPNSHCAILHESHYPLEMLLIDDASIVCEGLRIICIKFLPRKCFKCQKETNVNASAILFIMQVKAPVCFINHVRLHRNLTDLVTKWCRGFCAQQKSQYYGCKLWCSVLASLVQD